MFLNTPVKEMLWVGYRYFLCVSEVKTVKNQAYEIAGIS